MGRDLATTQPALGRATGSYGERALPACLQAHFACMWFHRLPERLPCPTAIVPDGYIDLQWFGGMLRIAGPDREANLEPIPAGITVIGFRFRPAAASAWLRVPASEIVNSRVPLDAFWGSETRRLTAWANDASTPEAVARRLVAALAKRAVEMDLPDRLASSVFSLIRGAQTAGRPFADDLHGRLGLSERTLRRRCHEAFGYGPKTLDRILRFQDFLRLARDERHAGVASLAAEAGYADQSHLTRETRRMAALTPKALLEQMGG